MSSSSRGPATVTLAMIGDSSIACATIELASLADDSDMMYRWNHPFGPDSSEFTT